MEIVYIEQQAFFLIELKAAPLSPGAWGMERYLTINTVPFIIMLRLVFKPKVDQLKVEDSKRALTAKYS